MEAKNNCHLPEDGASGVIDQRLQMNHGCSTYEDEYSEWDYET